MDAVIAQNLSARVEAAIKKVLAGSETDAFDAADFDPIAYINSRYKTEADIANLEPTIAQLEEEIHDLDESILDTVRVQSTAGRVAAKDLSEAKDSMSDLGGKIIEIKIKAQASEQLVQEICRDIKQLDVAKKHLTGTINALTRLQTLTSAVNDLREHAGNRNYEEAAPLLEASIALLTHLSEYRDIPKVSELANSIEKIREILRESVNEEFDILLDTVTPTSLAYEDAPKDGGIRVLKLSDVEHGTAARDEEGPRELSADNIATLQAACYVVDALGQKDKRQIIKSFNRKQLKPYGNLFRRGVDAGDSLEGIERRFAWFRKSIRDIDSRYGAVLPARWRVLHKLCVEFCEATRIDVERILSHFDPPSSAPAESLLRALMATQKFEKEMSKKFESEPTAAEDGARGAGTPDDEDGEVYDDSAPLVNERGQVVEPMSAEGIKMKYARKKQWERRREGERSRKANRDEKRRWIAGLAGGEIGSQTQDEDIASLPKIWVQGKGGIISNAFELYMGAYVRFERSKIEGQVSAALAEDFNPGLAQERGASANLLRSSSALFLECRNAVSRCHQLGVGNTLLTLFKEIKDAFANYCATLESRIPRTLQPPPPNSLPGDNYDVTEANGPSVAEMLSLIVNTADYCAETLPALADNIKKYVDDTNKEGIEMEGVADGFLTLQASAIRALAGVVACLLDPPLNALSKYSWEKVTEVGDQSPYVADVARILRLVMPRIKNKLNEAPFRNFCDKFARAFISRFQSSIFRCKKIGEMGAQQLLLDAQGLRSILLAAPTSRGATDRASSVVDDDDDFRPAPADDGRESGAPSIYIKTINRELPRVEMLFKIIAAPKERFADTIKALWPEASISELTRVMDLKGLNKKDATDVLTALGLAKAGAGISATMASSTAPIGTGVSNLTAGVREGTNKMMGKFLSAAKAATNTSSTTAKK